MNCEKCGNKLGPDNDCFKCAEDLKKEQLQIFKIQRPLFPANAECLIYNEDRSIESTLPQKALKQLFKPQECRIFVLGFMSGTILHIKEKISQQNW